MRRYTFTPAARADRTPARGEWRIIVGSVWVGCPDCGQAGTIDHAVDAAGRVSPSLVCPTKGCGFHEWAELAGWEP